jgi:hypothetical protein
MASLDDLDDADGPLAFCCPRCGAETTERLWGPCAGCRASLVASVDGEARQLEPGRFEPAMHVVPNRVATKD